MTPEQAKRIFEMARDLETTGRLCVLAKSEKEHWMPLHNPPEE